MKKDTLLWILIGFTAFMLVQTFSGEKTANSTLPEGQIAITTKNDSYATAKDIQVMIQNNTETDLTIQNPCPQPPITVNRKENDTFTPLASTITIKCTDSEDIIIPATKNATISLRAWKHTFFDTPGTYTVSLTADLNGTPYTATSPEFTITAPGIFTTLWRAGFYQPIYNTLIFLSTATPGENLAVGIILLTLIIRLILLVPSQHALQSQRRMQLLQPKIDAIKKKYAENQQKMAQEMTALWKENKVNPFGSCLPLVVQFPILIALYYAILDGLNPDNTNILYESLRHVDLTQVNTMLFTVLDLTEKNIYVLPIIIGGLQFAQIKLSLLRTKKKQSEKTPDEVKAMNTTMLYLMPAMIAFFTASVPAGVGLYWGISTIFGIVQQMVVNREKPLPQSNN